MKKDTAANNPSPISPTSYLTSDQRSVIRNQYELRSQETSSLISPASYLKRKTTYRFTLIELLVVIAIFAGLPLGAVEKKAVPVPAYPMEIEVVCGSPDSAEKADLKFLPLPPGKNVAFSCRWDDSNPRHLRMKRLMQKYGYKATFYITWPDTKFRQSVLPELCKDGFTVGNHTKSHDYLPMYTPNGIFYEMITARILHETLTGQTETAFIFPYGLYESRFYPDAVLAISSCLRRTGMLGGPDHATKRLSYRPDNEFFSHGGRSISPGDNHTRADKFDADVKRCLPESGKTAHLTLGVHVWHSDADFLELEKGLKKYSGREDWWFCNENEFLAYSYMLRHARVTGKKHNGKTVTFTLEMPCPEYLGSLTPLWAQCDGKNIEIKHTRNVPDKIAESSPKEGITPVFPGLRTKLSFPSPDRVRFEAENSGSPLNDVRLLLRLPPDFAEETLFCRVDSISGNYSKEWTVTPNPAGQSSGIQFTALQIDFNRDGSPGRLWVSRLQKKKPAPSPAKIICSNRQFSPQELEALARPGTESAGFVPIWHPLNYRETAFRVPGKIRNKKSLTVLMDFTGGRKMSLQGDLPKTVYCNGRKLVRGKDGVHFEAPAGNCRILLQYGESKRIIDRLHLILNADSRQNLRGSQTGK